MVIYEKTASGMAEMMARRATINSSLNSLLILIDGKRDEAEIRLQGKSSGYPDDALEILEHGGFIQKKLAASSLSSQATLAQLPKKIKPNSRPVPAAKVEEFQLRYAFLTRKSKVLLGLRGVSFQFQIERAKTSAELLKIVGPMSEAVAKKHGLTVAQNFKHESDSLLSDHAPENHTPSLMVRNSIQH